MKLLLDYRGREIRLTEERAQHILEHPEMFGMDSAMAQTLRNPNLVIECSSDSSAILHYRYYFGTKVGDKWLCVVVKYVVNDAFILTAYLTDKPKKGEQLWPSR